jgi:hypothetical protein
MKSSSELQTDIKNAINFVIFTDSNKRNKGSL